MPNSTTSLNPMAPRLGYAGLLPFALGAALVWLVRPEVLPYVSLGLQAWAGLVVSLLGGVYWGLGFRQAVPSPFPFAWGSLVAAVAWVGAVMPAHSGLVVHGVMFLVCYGVDRRHYKGLGAGDWLTMRFRLSTGAALCCFLAAQGL
ncbi:DUF3429 domain-containing protein [Roseateles sp. BYS180W]|uniref:DUF3429 domain-containing protein n=1 Tax=Roseateles rivi TaxID=3299028 RepID=A0ABW7FS84_9BURK